MVSTLNYLDEKFNRVRKNFCFYLDIQDHGLARSISRRIQDMGLQQEVFLTSRVSHVIRQRSAGAPRGGGTAAGAAPWPALREGRRAGAMLDRVRRDPPSPTHQHHHTYITLTVQKAITLLDKLYDTFFTASRKSHVKLFTKHFIKIEFLDKLCRPVFKEFDEWPAINTEPDLKREKKESTETPTNNNIQSRKTTAGQKMTRKSRPRVKTGEKEEKEKGGYCEICNAEYNDVTLHRRSPHHLAFIRDHTNFLALDSLITAGGDVTTFLNKANGERRSTRTKLCNGDDTPNKRSKRSQSFDSNDDDSSKKNGHNTRCSKRTDDRQYYKVVSSTKLRSSGGFAKKKESTPPYNGSKPLVVKFRKVRRSELSVLSDEAEQFMFPKRASSTSSTSSDDENDKVLSPKVRTPPQPQTNERRRLARPLELKEESSEEDFWPEDKRRKKKRGGAIARRSKRFPCRTVALELPVAPEPEPEAEPEPVEPPAVVEPPAAEPISPLREETRERCMKWEDGRLKYTPAVEQLEFAFETVPKSEPWFDTFKRQDTDQLTVRNIPQYFSLYTPKAPKLPYEIGQLPPLKPNCCPLSDLVKREEKPGPSRSYGTRGMKKQKFRKKTLLALEGHPRKSPREHASTLAILGSAGLVHRRKLADDTKSTGSEDTISDTQSNVKLEPVISKTQQASERLKQFFSEIFQEVSEYDVCDDNFESVPTVITSTNAPDVSSLVSECDDCDLIRNELKQVSERKGRRGKFKKKNRTGWPNKKKVKKDSRTNSVESENKTESLDRSSEEINDDTQDTIDDTTMSENENEKTVIENKIDDNIDTEESMDVDSDNKLLIDLKMVLDKKEEEKEKKSDELKKKKRALHGLCEWLQPVVRVARVEPAAARRLRSAARPSPRPHRHR